MASAPSDLGPVTGRVDRDGCLMKADPPLLRLQQEAGSKLGAPLALPQLAAVARSALKLGVPLSRAVLVASISQDLDLWVRVEPDEDGATLTIEGWKARAPAPPRLTLVGNEPEEAEAERLAFTTDPELKISRIDAELAARLGLNADEVIGQSLTRYFQLADDGEGAMPLLAALASRQDFAGQRVKVRGNGESEIIFHGTALHYPGKAFGGYEIEVALDADGGAPPGLVFDPALDEALRSPLDRIISAADHIVDRSEGPLRSDYAAYAGDIAAAGRHLLSVIRVMTQQEPAQVTEKVDVSSAVSEAVQLVQAKADERLVHLEFVGTDGAVIATGEHRSTVQILVNLLGNAVRHSPDGATVAIIVEQQVGKVVATIADEGPGIAEEDQQRIFERYERIGDTPGGVGLGLAISRRLARSMGGDIELQSAPGEGARFILTLSAA